MPETINKQQLSTFLNIDYLAVNRLIKNDANFPAPVEKKLGTGGGLFFDRTEMLNYATRHQKGFRNLLAQQAIQGKVWPIAKQVRHG